MFPFGWDDEYMKFVTSFVPRASSRAEMFSRGDLCWQGLGKEFIVGSGLGRHVPGVITARYKEVVSAGKCRPLLIFSQTIDLLGPLHKMIYHHLSQTDWLLVGPPTVEKISSTCKHPYQTSIDLKGATDSLRLDVTEAILGSLLRKAYNVPGAIKSLACSSLYPYLVTKNGNLTGEQVSHGQMMGGYLSFPLLCLQSYLAARWAARGQEACFLVNGDDTLVSSSDHYLSSESYPPGFILNREKTIMASNVAEVNSTVFLKESGKWREVRHLRRGGFLPDFPGMLHGAAACAGKEEWETAFVRSRIGKKWGFMPSQLGFTSRSFAVFQRQQALKKTGRLHTPLPCGSTAKSSLLRVERGRPCPDECRALREHMYVHGREAEQKRAFEPSIGFVRRTYSYSASVPRFWGTYLCSLGFRKVNDRKVVVKEETYSVPADYVSMKERIRDFHTVDADGIIHLTML